MTKQCSVCKERPAERAALRWYAIPLFLPFEGVWILESLCRDCAAGKNFLAVLFWSVILFAAFVIAVIFI